MDDDDQWPTDDAETFEGECDRCGATRPLQRVVDPFIVEGIIDGPLELESWCRPCFELRAGDV